MTVWNSSSSEIWNSSSPLPADVFDPAEDAVVEEYRGSGALKRWIDADNPLLPDFAVDPLAESLAGEYEYVVTGVNPSLGGPFAITSITLDLAGSAATVTWLSDPDTSYIVQRSADLRNWADIATVPSAGSSTSYNDATVPPAATQLFYRIVR